MKWIKLSEKKPENYLNPVNCIVHTDHFNELHAITSEGEFAILSAIDGLVFDYEERYGKVTYWMMMPNAPAKQLTCTPSTRG